MSKYYYFNKLENDNLCCFDKNSYKDLFYTKIINLFCIDKELWIKDGIINLTKEQDLSFRYSENPIIEIKRGNLDLFEEELKDSVNRFLFRSLMDRENIDIMYMEID